MIKKLFLFILLLFPAISQNAWAFSDDAHAKTSLISQKSQITMGESFYVAIKQEIDPHWHTYWRNAGDVGDGIRIEWELPKSFAAGEINWATPKIIPTSGFTDYGYENSVVLPIKISSNGAKAGEYFLKADIEWLECEKVCIPAQKEVEIKIKIGNSSLDTPQKREIDAAISALPKKYQNPAFIDYSGENIKLWFENENSKNIKSALFYPYELKSGALINHSAEQIFEFGEKGFSLKLEKSKSFPNNLAGEVFGLIEIKQNGKTEFFETNAKQAHFAAGFDGKKPNSFNWNDILKAAIFAFFGGIILNLMPCVFPILAMKVAGLSKIAHGHENEARNYGIFYALGVVLSFAALGGLIFIFGALGQAVGWGFQLQNPWFLAAMVILITILGFNLLGWFEIGLGLQNIAGNIAPKNGNKGAFFSGILAVMVASPCTAPFMGFALGFAATQSPIIGLLIFVFLGLGFALPYVALTFSPKLLQKLPRPGSWMDKLKQFLSIPMFLTAIWLLWVLFEVEGRLVPVLPVLALAILISFGLKLQNSGKNAKALWLVSFLGLVGASYLLVPPHIEKPRQASAEYETYSPQKRAEALKQGKIVFVNYTADWCITCKVNEANVFSNDKVKNTFTEKDVVYLVADFTRKDDNIARELSSHGRLGVPLYLVYRPNGKEPQILPQLLTPQIVIDAVSH